MPFGKIDFGKSLVKVLVISGNHFGDFGEFPVRTMLFGIGFSYFVMLLKKLWRISCTFLVILGNCRNVLVNYRK